MIRQKQQKEKFLKERFRHAECDFQNIEYIDLIKALQKMNCFGGEYIEYMKGDKIKQVTDLWQNLSDNNQEIVTMSKIVNLTITQNTSIDYNWIFINLPSHKSNLSHSRNPSIQKISVDSYRSTKSSNGRKQIKTYRQNSVNKQNISNQNIYIRRRVNKICKQFNKPSNKLVFLNPFNSHNLDLKYK